MTGALPVADRWFDARPVAEGLALILEPYVDPFLRSNAWLVRGRSRSLLVDTGNGIGDLRASVAELLDLAADVVALVTHAHSDHMGGLHAFDERVCHRAEVQDVGAGTDTAVLLSSRLPTELREEMAAAGSPLPDLLVTAIPHTDFDPATYAVTPTTPTRVVDEGDVIDLGDRAFEVLHLPGHTPGSIGLWEEATGTLFSGDTVYRDDVLLDQLPGSDIGAYVGSMRRLRELPVLVVHGGHDPSFGRERLVERCDEYLARRGRG